jgi:hypothetical protein
VKTRALLAMCLLLAIWPPNASSQTARFLDREGRELPIPRASGNPVISIAVTRHYALCRDGDLTLQFRQGRVSVTQREREFPLAGSVGRGSMRLVMPDSGCPIEVTIRSIDPEELRRVQ